MASTQGTPYRVTLMLPGQSLGGFRDHEQAAKRAAQFNQDHPSGAVAVVEHPSVVMTDSQGNICRRVEGLTMEQARAWAEALAGTDYTAEIILPPVRSRQRAADPAPRKPG